MIDITDSLVKESLEVMSLDSRFHSDDWKQFTFDAIWTCAPIGFFLQAASSSGKYHQGYELGIGGLVRHTVAVMEVARTLFPLYEFSPEEQDSIIAACAVHDIGKPDKDHPIRIKLLLEPLRDLYPDKFKTVVDLVKTHHGQWDNFGKFPRPKTEAQKFIHLCDFLASRKNIAVDINFEEERT